jgi:predicted PurR-regulated permease PerM
MVQEERRRRSIDHAVDIAIRIAMLGLLIYFCYRILNPFIELLLWGAILATAVFPVYRRLLPRFQNREGWTATFMVVVALLILIVPVYQLTVSFVDTMQTLNARFEDGSLTIPEPNDSVLSWPIIGERLHAAWGLAISNLESLVIQYQDELATVSQRAVGVMAGLGGAVGSFILSTVVAGVFLAFASECYNYAVRVLDRLMDSNGEHFAELGTQTIRSVAQGVIGVAIIQATFSSFGLVAMDVPAVGVWVLLVLILTVMQLPALLILGPIAIYVFTVADLIPSILFLVYCILVSSSDAILKPIFLGRGMTIPMPIILLGAIGGLIAMGILGLFIGAIVLAIGYTLFSEWVDDLPHDSESP